MARSASNGKRFGKRALNEIKVARISNRSRAKVSVFKVKKVTRKATPKGKEREYWYSAWSIVGRTRNVYLGSCDKMSREEALEKARAIKRAQVGDIDKEIGGYNDSPSKKCLDPSF